MIVYRDSIEGVTPGQLKGFFVGWPHPPSTETHLELLRNSSRIVLAIDGSTDRIVGFITAISDHVLSAYIPFLEVLPPYRGRGIGTELVRRMMRKLQHLYMVDLMCDPGLRRFYASVGMQPGTGMMLRNYAHQGGPEREGT